MPLNNSRADDFDARTRSGGDPRLSQRRRPSAWEWLKYTFGAGLGPQLSQWVLRDTTGPTWWLRHLVRSMLWLVLPVAAIVVFLPGPLDLRIYTAVLGVRTTEHRLVKAGFSPGEGEQVRQERAARRRHE